MRTADVYRIAAILFLSHLLSGTMVGQHFSRTMQRVSFSIQPEHRASARTTGPSSALAQQGTGVNAVMQVDLFGQKDDKVTVAFQSNPGSLPGTHMLLSGAGFPSLTTTTRFAKILPDADTGVRARDQYEFRLAATGAGDDGRIILTVTE